ncbi:MULTISPECIES: helix-turn-helix domain-containing protein [unclassified Streptomyces]|uniref:helix-turn-helix domain-containing protein n=1 Tax=unclassified Streptomyces TaxID=2593676 RepID=UPI002E27AC02|nr:helix-turn-helix transcriptional regulator [Streptomyces sp. NBC_00223]
MQVEGGHLNRRTLDPTKSPHHAFGSQLRSSREAAGLTQDQLGERMGYTGTYISAVEVARKSPARKFARAADKTLGTGQTLELMWIGLRRQGFIDGFPEHASQEARAAEIRIFEPNIIPGLLQTRDYAAALTTSEVLRGSITEDQAGERLKFLAVRQRLLDRSTPPLIHAILDESCIRRPIGGADVMREQLGHLSDLAARPNVITQVAPYSLAGNAPFRAFMTLLTFTDRSVIGYTESVEQGYVVRNEETVRAWEADYHRLQVEALSQAASMAMIRTAREELTR